MQCRMRCKRSPLLLAVGVPLFRKLDDGYMTEIGLACRWRPTLGGACLLGKLARCRTLRVDRDTMRDWVAARSVPRVQVEEMAQGGQLEGFHTLGGQLGGALLGLVDNDEFWVPVMVHGQGLDIYANAAELGLPPADDFQFARAAAVDVPVIARSEHAIAVNKPIGVTTETVLQGFGAMSVSRLDRLTSGVLVAALTDAGFATLSAAFRERHARKTYICIVHGAIDAAG